MHQNKAGKPAPCQEAGVDGILKAENGECGAKAMEYLRLELRLVGARFGARTTVDGPAAGDVTEATIDPATWHVLQVVVPTRTAREQGLMASAATASGAVITAQTQVVAGKRKLGAASRLWVNRPDEMLTHVLVSIGGQEYIVPVGQIAKLEDKQIVLVPEITGAHQLRIYREDPAIAAEVARALEATLLDPHARRAVHARIEDGHVDLSGIIDAEEEYLAVIGAIRRIPGVRGVQADLIVTERLADQVAAAIGALEAKGALGDDPQIEVLSEHQIVYLTGSVASSKVSADAERAAIAVPGVRIVVNQLQVRAPITHPRPDPASPPTHNR
jgi:osmotically-inducible protein OsmY